MRVRVWATCPFSFFSLSLGQGLTGSDPLSGRDACLVPYCRRSLSGYSGIQTSPLRQGVVPRSQPDLVVFSAKGSWYERVVPRRLVRTSRDTVSAVLTPTSSRLGPPSVVAPRDGVCRAWVLESGVVLGQPDP